MAICSAVCAFSVRNGPMNVLNSYDGSFISEKDSPILWCGLFF